jgi:small subunit ribosomal protein S2
MNPSFQVQLKEFTEASLHYGHPPKEWNPKMAPYLLSVKHGYHLFDLVKTMRMLKSAGEAVEFIAKKGGKFLFVGTNKLSSSLIAKEAIRRKSFYLNSRWLGGTLTNWVTIQKQIERLKILEEDQKQGKFILLSKKEQSKKRKELDKLKKLFDGIKQMKTLPDLVIFTSPLKDGLAISECLRLGIPAIAIVDSNCNPDFIPYPIPANDDSSASISYILNYLGNKISEGYNIRKEK